MGFTVGLEKVRRWMKRLSLVAKHQTASYPFVQPVIAPNKLNRQFNPEQLNTIVGWQSRPETQQVGYISHHYDLSHVV